MADMQYPGILLNRLPEGITKAEIRHYVIGQVGLRNLAEGGPFVDLYLNARPRKAVVFGIHLTLLEIKERFGNARLKNSFVFVSNVDWGLPRLDTGLHEHDDMIIHNRLSEAQGLRPIMNVFPKFVNDNVYPLEELTTVLYIEDVEPSLDVGKLNDLLQTIIWISKTTGRGTSHNFVRGEAGGSKTYTVTSFEMPNRFEALQAICFVSQNSDITGAGAKFILSNDGKKKSKMNQKMWLGVGNTRIDVTFLLNQCGYIPFPAITERAKDDVKTNKFTKICWRCDKNIDILGIGPDCTWLAGRCSCNIEQSLNPWTNEQFTRWITHKNGRISLSLSESPRRKDVKIIPLFPFIRGILPMYEDPRDFRSANAAARANFQYKQKQLKDQETVGTLVVRDFLHGLGDGKEVFRLKFRVIKTKLWSPEGITEMRTATVIPMVNSTDGKGNLVLVKAKTHLHMSGIVYSIDCQAHAPGTSRVTLQVTTQEGGQLIKGNQFTIVPHPPDDEVKGLQRTISKWEKFYDDRRNAYKFNCDIANPFIVRKEFRDGSLVPFNVWHLETIAPFEKVPTDLIKQFEKIYIGCEIDIKVRQLGEVGESRFRETGRIVGLQQIDDDSSRVCLEVFVSAHERICFASASRCVLELWGLSPPQDECVESDDGENEEVQGRKLKVIYQKMPRHNPADLRTPSGILRTWFEKPNQGYKMLDYLLYSSQHVEHPTEVYPPFDESNLTRGISGVIYETLNEGQKEAVTAFMRRPLSLCQGPPGSGKTFMLSAAVCILSQISNGLILVTAPSNESSEVTYINIEKCMKRFNLDLDIVVMKSQTRERFTEEQMQDLPTMDQNLLHVRVLNDPEWRENDDINLLIDMQQEYGSAILTREQQEMLREHKKRIMSKIIASAQVLICTVGCSSDHRIHGSLGLLRKMGRSLEALITDEASLLTYPGIVPVLSLGPKRCFLVGDHKQLNPIVMDPSALEAALDTSCLDLFLLTKYVRINPDVFVMLREQYRMCESICKVVSGYSYQKKLESSESVVQRDYASNPKWTLLRKNIPELKKSNMAFFTYEDFSDDKQRTGSKFNMKEVNITKMLLQKLFASNVPMESVWILSMYNAQIDKLKAMKRNLGSNYEDCRILSTDASQGKEASIIIINLVRSNKYNDIGFLRDHRRILVSISRAIDYLIIVGHRKTFEGTNLDHLIKLVGLFNNNGMQWKKYDGV